MATIRELPSGKFQVQVRHRGMPPVGKSFNSKHEAAHFARLLESEFDRGVFIDRTEAQRSTLGELIDRHWAEVTPRKKSARREVQRLNLLKKRFPDLRHKAVSRLFSG